MRFAGKLRFFFTSIRNRLLLTLLLIPLVSLTVFVLSTYRNVAYVVENRIYNSFQLSLDTTANYVSMAIDEMHNVASNLVFSGSPLTRQIEDFYYERDKVARDEAQRIIESTFALSEDIAARRMRVDDDGILFLLPDALDEDTLSALERQLSGDAFLLLIRGTYGVAAADITYRARMFFLQEYFYAKLPNLRVYEVDLTYIPVPPADGEALRHIREELFSFSWINDRAQFDRILRQIPEMLLSPAIVADLFFSVRDKWLTLFGDRLPGLCDIAISHFAFWYQWTDWVGYLRQQLLIYGGFSDYAPEIAGAIQRLLLTLNENLAKGLTLNEAAAQANLSPSYFAKCFRKITGQTYTVYVRTLRMEYGAKLLVQTGLPITRIAELCGLPDPFYFSKLFKREYGLSPSAYRTAAVKGK